MLWLILGLIIGALAAVLFMQSKKGAMKVTWYQWVLGAIALVLLLLTLQNYLGFGRELEGAAQSFVLIAMGIPAVIFAVLAVFLPKLFKKKA